MDQLCLLIGLKRYQYSFNNPANKKDVEACALYIKQHLEKIGMEHAEVYPTDGHPVVYADWLHAGKDKPTALIYGHYDVQPVDPLDLWTSPPFKAEVRNGNIYARGSADDKGQVMVHLKALEAHLKNNKSLPVNLKIIIEGEEEIGSMHLDDFIESHKDLLIPIFKMTTPPTNDPSIVAQKPKSLTTAPISVFVKPTSR